MIDATAEGNDIDVTSWIPRHTNFLTHASRLSYAAFPLITKKTHLCGVQCACIHGMQSALHAHSDEFVHVDVRPVKVHAGHATAQVSGPPLGACPQVEQPEVPVAVAGQELPVCPLVNVSEGNRETFLQCIRRLSPSVSRIVPTPLDCPA
jgi:hypothetical protein